MSKLEEFFTPDRLARLEAEASSQDKAQVWYEYDHRAKQHLSVYNQREVIQKFSDMLDGIRAQVEEIKQFIEDNDIPGVDYYYTLDELLNTDPVQEALDWAASNHNC